MEIEQVEQQEKSPEQLQHESNKTVRHGLASAHYLLCNQTKYMFEQFAEVQHAIAILAALCTDLQQKIEKVEPPVKEDTSPKKPYVMDVPTRG